jgi:hemerythrin-like metal-binding protein/PAS domain S-box-containing protein
MSFLRLAQHSLKTRITLATLTIFVISIWSLSLYTSRMLRADMQDLLGEQQLSTVSMLAAEANQELGDRMKWLESVAEKITPAMLDNSAVLQEFLAQRLILARLFGGGGIIYRSDGTAIADSLPATGRIGVNYMNVDTVAKALNDGKSNIGTPVMGRKLGVPVFGMTVPIRDAQGKVIGAFAGVTNLGVPNFLDKIQHGRYGKTGGYLLVARQSRSIITATDKTRIMEVLPAQGISPRLDRFIDGFEGSDVFVSPVGVEVLVSAKGIPVAGWYVASILPTDEAFAPIYAMQHRMLVVTIFLTLLAGGLTWWLLRRQLAPMLDTARILGELAGSNKPLHALPITRQDEIGELIGGFNRLLNTVAQRDVTLQQRDEILRSILEASLDGFWRVDSQGHLIDVNPTYCQQSGYAREELIEMQVSDLEVLESAAETKTRIRRLIETGSDQFESRHRRKDGSIWDVEVSASYREAAGGLLSVFLRDITERKRAEEVDAFLAQAGGGNAEEPFFDALARFLAQSLQMDYVCIDMLEGDGLSARTLSVWHDGNFEENVTYALKDTPCGDVVGQQVCCFPASVTQFFPRDQALQELRAESYVGITLWSHTGKPIGLIAVIGRRPLTRRSQAEATMERVGVRAAGELERLMGETEIRKLNSDLEQRVRLRTADLEVANRSLTLAKIQADTANVAKSAFLANMSHEIRTPMNGIVGMANILRREGVTPKQAQRLDTIDAATQHLLSVINDVLDISKIEAGKLTMEEVPVAVSSLMTNVSSILSERVKAKGIQLLIETEHLPRNLAGDPTRLQQALLNIATNAVKFTEQGTVTLRAIKQLETAGDVVLRFEVQDPGIGIAPEAMLRLFSTFEQADNSMTRKYGGTGLGLAITKRLVELMGGEVGADSTPGVGSTFWFTVRLKKSSKAAVATMATAVDAEAEIRKRYAGQRILVVDDEPLNREVAVMQLEAVDLVVDMAEDGEDAIAMTRRECYAAIFMDMQMPKMNGLEATSEIRHLPGYRDVPIIAMTANAFAEDKERCLKVGMSGFLSKPFRPDELFAILLSALSQDDELLARLEQPNGETGKMPTRIPGAHEAVATQAAATTARATADAGDFLEKVVWNDTFSVGVAEMDAQHRKLLILINQLVDCHATRDGTASEKFHDVLSSMFDYALVHFKAEEAYLQRIGYPQLSAHEKEHSAFVEKMTTYSMAASHGVLDCEGAYHYMREWVLSHILKSDMQYRQFVEGRQDAS